MKLKLTTSCPATICHRPQVIAPGICIDVDLHLRSSVEHYLTEVQRDWAREKRAPSPLTLYPPPPDTFSLTALHHRQRLYCMFPPRLVTQSFRIFFRLTAFFFGIIICTREHWHSTRQERTEPLYSATIRHISLDCPSLPPPVTLLEEYFSAHLAAYSFYFFFAFFVVKGRLHATAPTMTPLAVLLVRHPLCTLDTLDSPRRRCPLLRPTTSNRPDPASLRSRVDKPLGLCTHT